jgi:hypothetical protein
MKSSVLAVLLVLGVGVAVASTRPSGDRPLVMLSADKESVFKQTDTLTRAFLAGTVKSLAYYNLMLRMKGKESLFCKPGDGLGLDEFWNLAAEVLNGAHSQDTIVTTGLHLLIDKYPCKNSEQSD